MNRQESTDVLKPVDIAYIVSHGFAARMVTQTDLLGKLADEGLKVALISPDAEDANLAAYCQSRNISLVDFQPDLSKWLLRSAKARMYFLENIEANPALLEKYQYEAYIKPGKGWSRLKINLLKRVHDWKERFPWIKRWYLNRETKLLSSPEAQDLISRLKPKILVSTYPVNFQEGMLLKAAKEQQLKTVIQLLSWDNISCKGHFPQLADHYLAWGQVMTDELKEYYGVDESAIDQVGVPHFDLHLKVREQPQPGDYLKALGLDPKQPYLFFGMSSPRFAPFEIDIVEWLAGQIETEAFGQDLQLVVRPHPQNVQGNMADQSWLPRLKKLAVGKVGVDFPDLSKSKMPWSMQKADMERMSHLLAGSALCLNSGSTLSIDALMCKVPVVLTSFDADQELPYCESARRLIDYTHLKKLVGLGGVSVCQNYKELDSQINKYLLEPNSNLKDRTLTASKQCANYEGEAATDKTVNKIIHFVELQ